MSNPVLDVVSNIIPISPELLNDLNSKILHSNFPKKHILLKKGQVCDYLYFVDKGLLRAYYDNEEGNDLTSWFMKENDFIISVISFYDRIESHEAIEVLEECELYYIHFDDLQELYAKHIEFNIVGRILTEKYYRLSEQRMAFMRGKSAKDKYNSVLTNTPELLQRATKGHIATFLGVTLETLSRIRSNR